MDCFYSLSRYRKVFLSSLEKPIADCYSKLLSHSFSSEPSFFTNVFKNISLRNVFYFQSSPIATFQEIQSSSLASSKDILSFLNSTSIPYSFPFHSLNFIKNASHKTNSFIDLHKKYSSFHPLSNSINRFSFPMKFSTISDNTLSENDTSKSKVAENENVSELHPISNPSSIHSTATPPSPPPPLFPLQENSIDKPHDSAIDENLISKRMKVEKETSGKKEVKLQNEISKKNSKSQTHTPEEKSKNQKNQNELDDQTREKLKSRIDSKKTKFQKNLNPLIPANSSALTDKKLSVENNGTDEIFESENDKKNAKALADAIMSGYFTGGFRKGQNDSDADESETFVPIEKQKSLKIAIVGAPNAGKSVLTNLLVGSKVSAVSRKTNTTKSEILGICTMGDTQLLIYDTPGLLHPLPYNALSKNGKKSTSAIVSTLENVELLILLIDAERQLRMPDPRVKRMVLKMGSEKIVGKKKIAVLNKVDIIKDKKQLLPMAKELAEMHAIDEVFMISGLSGSGLKEMMAYIKNSALLRPWEEDPHSSTNQTMHNLAMEIIHEHIMDRLHQDLPYLIEKRLSSWKYLSDGSVRIEVSILVETESQKAIVVGRAGQAIRQIGIASRMEIDKVLGIRSHVILNVKIKPK